MTKSRNRRIRLAEAQNWRCAYCSGEMLMDGTADASSTIDHIFPRSRGGSLGVRNCVAACRACNGARGTIPPDRFWRRRTKLLAAGVWPMCSKKPRETMAAYDMERVVITEVAPSGWTGIDRTYERVAG